MRHLVHQIAAVTSPLMALRHSDLATAILALTAPVSSSLRNILRSVFSSIGRCVLGLVTNRQMSR